MLKSLGWMLSLCVLTACGGSADNHTEGPKVNPGEKHGPSQTPADAPLGSPIAATLVYLIEFPAEETAIKIPNPWDDYRSHFATNCASCHDLNGPRPRLDSDPMVNGDASYFLSMTGSRAGLNVAIPRDLPYDDAHKVDQIDIWRPIAEWAEYVNTPKCEAREDVSPTPSPEYGLVQWTSDSNGAASTVWQNMTLKVDGRFMLDLGTLQVGSKVSAHIRLFDTNHVELADYVMKPSIVNGQGKVMLSQSDAMGNEGAVSRSAPRDSSCRE